MEIGSHPHIIREGEIGGCPGLRILVHMHMSTRAQAMRPHGPFALTSSPLRSNTMVRRNLLGIMNGSVQLDIIIQEKDEGSGYKTCILEARSAWVIRASSCIVYEPKMGFNIQRIIYC